MVKNAAGQLLQASPSDQFCRTCAQVDGDEHREKGHDQRAWRYDLPQLDHTSAAAFIRSWGHSLVVSLRSHVLVGSRDTRVGDR